MSTISPLLGRTSSLMSSALLRQRLQDTQRELLQMQDQISTGQAVSRGSDAPGSVSAILFLNQSAMERQQQQVNLNHATGVLNLADVSLGDVTNILIEAQQIASSQIGVGSDADTREAQSQVIDAQLRGILEIANRQYNNLSLFGGSNGAGNDGLIFEEFLGGIRYTGTDVNLFNDVGAIRDEQFTSNGFEAFGALSTRVRSQVDLDPQASPGILLSDINGARGAGFSAGSINLTVNAASTTVDLSTANSLEDVGILINFAIQQLDPAAGSVELVQAGYTLDATPGNTITIADPQGGVTAADLGLNLSATSTTVLGANLNVRLTENTPLGDLGIPVDLGSGLLITQGENSGVADFSDAGTIQDLQNAVQALGLGVRLTINAEGTGLDITSEVSGISLSVGENGGTTASDFGLRTLDGVTELAEFRQGIGVETSKPGEPDVSFTLHDGTTFTVDLASAVNVDDVIALVQAEATANGLTVGVDFEITMATTGNGLVVTDNTAGANDFVVANAGLSLAAEHLGLVGNAGSGATIAGEDTAQVRVDNMLTHLMELRAALATNNELGITIAGSSIEDDIDQVISARAEVGVQARRIEDQLRLVEDQGFQEERMLSELQDADLTEVLTKFSQLQLQLQASMQVGSSNLQLSLLDFLR
ncbi:flagellin [Phycisphaeraceae bacterium D3-23]